MRIPKVGVRRVYAPFYYLNNHDGVRETAGEYSLYASLEENFKGTNMSRFIEVLNDSIADSSKLRGNAMFKYLIKIPP